MTRLACYLPSPVGTDFNARFDAIDRGYLYRILDRRTPSSLRRHQLWHHRTPLDVQAMHEAAQQLVGHHDFTSFRATGCQANSPLRTLNSLSVSREGDEVHIRARARSFYIIRFAILPALLPLSVQENGSQRMSAQPWPQKTVPKLAPPPRRRGCILPTLFILKTSLARTAQNRGCFSAHFSAHFLARCLAKREGALQPAYGADNHIHTKTAKNQADSRTKAQI